MKTRHYFPTLSCTFLLIAGIAACEKNPNTEVKSAQTELTSEQRKAQQDEAELRQKQANERTENRNADVEEQAELRRKQQGERTETAAEGQIATSDAQRDVTHAREKMAQDRRDFGTKSSERLVKLDSRAQEMKTKSAKLAANKKQEFNTGYARYLNERDALSAKINGLSNVGDDDWQNAKKDVERKLDALDDNLDKMGKGL
ncbi:MAG: hypothetical protein K0S65_1099 [Labilithrix sp.]|nr:hypothetical protein [Labilithrix sp.]